jgi:hypothetical protein
LVIFYTIGEGLGYNVPIIFMTITNYDGFVSAGSLITEYSLITSDTPMLLTSAQHATAPEMLRLDRMHLELYIKSMEPTARSKISFAEALQINVWEQYP